MGLDSLVMVSSPSMITTVGHQRVRNDVSASSIRVVVKLRRRFLHVSGLDVFEKLQGMRMRLCE